MKILKIAQETAHINGREIHILRPEGDIDAHAFPLFEEAVTKLVEDGYHHLRIDLEKLTHINSTALGFLVATWREVHQHGGSLVVDTSKASDKLKQILRSLGIRFDDDEGYAGVAVRRPPPTTPPRSAENRAEK